jgi:cytochrome c oxidase assembly protein subunit 15
MTIADPSGRSSKPVAIWLLAGVFMIIVQVLLGGITRVTGSGLSITEWKLIMGTLPPMNQHEWEQAFEKYKQIAQFKYVNAFFTLQDFKHIFFWEWIHRLWARLIAVAFAIPFVIFLLQRRFRQSMIRPLLILFLLGGLQGLVGWIMVKSGLEESQLLYVSHYRLAIHFVLALGLLCYATWFALQLLVPSAQIIVNRSLRNFTIAIIILLVLQLIYGAFMAGLKIAAAAPTWPTINGGWLPGDVRDYGSRHFYGLSFLTDHPMVIHFIHRLLAYLLFILVLIWTTRALRVQAKQIFRRSRIIPLLIVIVQILLGIFTVLFSTNKSVFVWLAVAHQFTAMLLLLSFIWMVYLVRLKTV